MRAPRSPDRTQTAAGAISYRRPDRTYGRIGGFGSQLGLEIANSRLLGRLVVMT
jgi:hypothetical protein